jgi:hypothetical protein
VVGAVGEHLRDEEVQAAAEQTLRRAAAATFEGLTAEERRDAIRQLSHDLAAGASAAIRSEMEQAIGPDGNGPLASVVGRVAERIVQSTVFPECTGANRTSCVRRQIESMSQASIAALMRAVRDQLGLGALLLAFSTGILVALVAVLLWSAARDRPRRRQVSGAPVTTA